MCPDECRTKCSSVGNLLSKFFQGLILIQHIFPHLGYDLTRFHLLPNDCIVPYLQSVRPGVLG
eukprot:3155738-Amphidinium_carterae.2